MALGGISRDRRGGTPLFLTTATRDSDGAKFLVGVNFWGTTHNGQYVLTTNAREQFIGTLTADMFPNVNDVLRLGNGSYFKCTSKTENVGLGTRYPGTKVELWSYKNIRIGQAQMFNEFYSYNETTGTYRKGLCQNWSLAGSGLERTNRNINDYDSFMSALQDTNSEIYTVSISGVFLWSGVIPPPSDWRYNQLITFSAGGGSLSSQQKQYLYDFWGPNVNNPNLKNDILPPDFTLDYSEPNVPNADYPSAFKNDNTDFTNTNTMISSSDLGVLNLYSPTFGEMLAFHNYLWSSDFLQNWESQLKKLFGSPEEQIIALLAIYADIPLNASTATIVLGNINSGVSSATVAKQYITLDCGSIDVPRVWGNFLDFEPYTTISIYLPFISTVELSANEIVGKNLHLQYKIDVLTGACVAQLKISDEERENVILNVSGNCGIQLPWSSANYNQLVSNSINALATIGATTITGGLAPILNGETTTAGGGELAISGSGTLKNVFSGASPRFSRGGSFNTNNGVLCDKIPHLLITRPIQSLAQNYNTYNGFPSNVMSKIGALKGFTIIDKINLQGVTATAEEQEQIIHLLKTGVLIT